MEIKKFNDGGIVRFESELASKKLIIETGHMAGQADGSCTVQLGGTVVLATAVMADEPREGIDYFPLMVDYEERLYAAGKIKGSRWIKREGRPTDDAILAARMVDRAIRPLFNKKFRNDVQVILTVLSFDSENDPDIVSLIAASTALAISKIPWKGPIGGIRLGYYFSEESKEKGEWTVNPGLESLNSKSSVDLVVAGIKEKIIMIEAGAKEIPEDVVYQGIELAAKTIKKIILLIEEVAKEVGREKVAPDIEEAELEEEEVSLINEAREKAIKWIEENAGKKIFSQDLKTKISRKQAVEELEEELEKYLKQEGVGKEKRKKALSFFGDYIESMISAAILKDEKRVDGRKLDEIRPLSVEVGLLPRTHGSALFSRGETQVLSVITLGAPGDEQFLDGMEETGKKRYMHHYNFPGFSVGEVSPVRSPGRREIGHGSLAERALSPVLPEKESFPYTIRVVSEVLSSNGSSSMASVCGSALALMDAGVPIKRPVAGIAMGLASDESNNYKVLTDLQDLEDGKGGMDFKIAGTDFGITAIQMDTKTDGLTMEIIKKTIDDGLVAIKKILQAMTSVIKEPRPELSQYAPRIVTINIDPEKIRDVIGPGGKIINEIIDKTGVQIDIEQDGTVLVTSVNEESSKKAVDWIKKLTKQIQVGEIYEGEVVRIMDFGAFVKLTPNQDGMVHISELAPYHVKNVKDVVKLGDNVTVKVVKIDEHGRINLSIKALANSNGSNNGSDRRFDKRDRNQKRDRFH